MKSNDLANIIQSMKQPGSRPVEIPGPRPHYQFSEQAVYYSPYDRDYYAYPFPGHHPYAPLRSQRRAHIETETILSAGALTLAFIVDITMFVKRKFVAKTGQNLPPRNNRSETV